MSGNADRAGGHHAGPPGDGVEFDPAQFYRGDVGRYSEGEESDSCGIVGKHAFSLEYDTPDGHHCLVYGAITGCPWMSPDRKTIEVPFHGWLRHEGEWQEAIWLAVIEGRDLASVFGHIRDDRRVSVHRSQSPPPAGKAEVTGVAFRKLAE